MAIISDIQLSKNGWFSDEDARPLTTSFVEFNFGFPSFSITLINDDENNSIDYSFDGSAVHGRLRPGEIRKMDFCRHGMLWLRGGAGGEPYRLEVY